MWSRFHATLCFLVVFSIVTVAISSSAGVREFGWSSCPALGDAYIRFVGVDITRCASECQRRGVCRGLAFWRHVKLCAIYSYDDTVSPVAQTLIPCVYVDRQDIVDQANNPCIGCGQYQVCDFETNTCKIEECPPFSLENGVTRGNVNYIGSRKTYECNSGYLEQSGQTVSTCLQSGNWDYIPACAPIGGLGIGEPCIIDDQCDDPNSYCSTVCQCNPNFSYSTNTHTCVDTVCELADADWWEHPSFRLQFHFMKKSFDNARSACTAQGGDLVKIDLLWKLEYINALLHDCASNRWGFWTDGRGVNNRWIFRDGTLMPTTEGEFWVPGTYDPVPSSSNDCVRLDRHDDVWMWNDKDCSDKYYFICEDV